MKPNHSRNGHVNLADLPARRRKKKTRKSLIITNVVTSIVLVFSIIMMSGMLMLNMNLEDTRTGSEPVESGATGEPQDEFRDIVVSPHEDVSYILVAGLDEEETLTDILMVVCFDHGRGTANILQIPRDTYVGSDVRTGKVNATYGSAREGESMINKLIRKINTHFGLPIDHYVLLNLSAFRNIIDAVGGVELNIPERLRVADSVSHELYYIGPGLTLLDGQKAEAFIRCRSGQNYKKGDMSRVEAQRTFYAAFAQKVIDMSLGQMFKIASSCYNKVNTDMSIGEVLGYAEAAKQLTLDQIQIHSVPGQGGYFTPEGMRQELSYYSIHKDEYVEMINQYFMPYGGSITESSIQIEELHTTKYQSEIDGETSFQDLITAQTQGAQ